MTTAYYFSFILLLPLFVKISINLIDSEVLLVKLVKAFDLYCQDLFFNSDVTKWNPKNSLNLALIRFSICTL